MQAMRSADGTATEAHPLRAPGAILLVSCYELGRQPLSVANAAAILTASGFAPQALDLARVPIDAEAVRRARLIAVSVPMHTALRLGVAAAERLRALNPEACLCFYGLYAWLNAESLLAGPADAVIGGECDEPLLSLAQSLAGAAATGMMDAAAGAGRNVPGVRTRTSDEGPWLARPRPLVPERSLLPAIDGYVHIEADGERLVAGQVESSRGCRHLCRHCPIPPVYGGRFFVVPAETVLEDARRQVEAGARHLSFADPDFLNGPGHAMKVARALHAAHPGITFDFTAKIEHLVKHRDRLAELRDLGCLFIISAVESIDDRVLRILDKGHTRSDVEAVLAATRAAGLTLRPTFVPFTPWTGLEGQRALIEFIVALDLVDAVDPIQTTIRLLVPPGSLLLEHEEMKPHLAGLDAARFTWTWRHPDPRVDALQIESAAIVEAAARAGEPAEGTFRKLAAAAGATTVPAATDAAGADSRGSRRKRRPAPRLTEPWFCCAEPMEGQLAALRSDDAGV
ncbi:MAG TPA: CUAEP/CCAEP-tail radical SAM protein [Candidatus Polarisedimenticolia bacterium]|nr:CUAEP/CCAEP-tail radical SAM protein [Candidatus Polarisedimenticolia bacterium]